MIVAMGWRIEAELYEAIIDIKPRLAQASLQRYYGLGCGVVDSALSKYT